MTFQERNLPKKYIKRMFHKPHRAYCKKCNAKMFLLPEDENPGKILFRCVSSTCGDILDLTEYKSKYSLSRNKKMNVNGNIFTRSSLVNMTLTLHHYRIKDKFYIVDDVHTYNPVTRMKRGGQAFLKVTDEEHEKLLTFIKESLANASN